MDQVLIEMCVVLVPLSGVRARRSCFRPSNDLRECELGADETQRWLSAKHPRQVRLSRPPSHRGCAI